MATEMSYYGVLGAYPATIVAGEDGVALSLSALSLLWDGEKRQNTNDLKKWIRQHPPLFVLCHSPPP